jgi:diguanylate cyclase (GGDEF)-like protein
MELLNRRRFDELKATGQLPSPTGVALKILKMAQTESVGLAEVARVVKGDPALAARLLQLVNSACYAGASPVTAVADAVTRIGMTAVWQVALGFSVISGFRRGVCRYFEYDQFWSQSLATAVAAQILSCISRMGQPEEAFTCGILSRIGRLGLACIYPEAYSDVLSAAQNQGEEELLRLEQHTFATDHCELAAAMLNDWGLAENWIMAVRHCEDPLHSELPESEEAQRLAWLLHASIQLGAICVAPAEQRGRLLRDLYVRVSKIGLQSEGLLPVCDNVAREWVAWGKVLGIKTAPLPSFETITVESEPAEFGAPDGNLPLQCDAAGVRALVVDEDPSTFELVRHRLPAGSVVLCARTGNEANRMALEFDPHLIIADWKVQGIGGAELCRGLRKTKTGQQVYILILAHDYDENLLAGALEAGANEYIMKPILPRVLEARIGVALRVIRLQQEVIRDREEIRRHLAELSVLNRMLEQAALTDALTGLPNRRYALDRLGQEWASSLRKGGPLACLMIDVDRFKRVNDTHGHDAGDRVLREIASVLRKAVRATDVVCRVGGEEFLVICRDTDASQAAICAERLRHRVESHRIEEGGAGLAMTISVGIAARTASVADVEALLKLADIATYKSKIDGRNRITLAGGA